MFSYSFSSLSLIPPLKSPQFKARMRLCGFLTLFFLRTFKMLTFKARMRLCRLLYLFLCNICLKRHCLKQECGFAVFLVVFVFISVQFSLKSPQFKAKMRLCRLLPLDMVTRCRVRYVLRRDVVPAGTCDLIHDLPPQVRMTYRGSTIIYTSVMHPLVKVPCIDLAYKILRGAVYLY